MNNALKHNGTNASRPQPAAASVYYAPRVDILEGDDELTLYADLPGVKPEDVDVRLDNGELTLQARCAPRAQSGIPLLAEYGVGDFYRAFTVGEGVDAAKITAELKQGVLTVHLPRSETVKPKQIQVKGE